MTAIERAQNRLDKAIDRVDRAEAELERAREACRKANAKRDEAFSELLEISWSGEANYD